MKSLVLGKLGRASALAVGVLLSAAAAHATPVTWDIDKPNSNLNVKLTISSAAFSNKSGNGNTKADGFIYGDLTNPAGPSPSSTFTSGAITLDNLAFSINLGGLLGSLNITSNAVGGTISGGPTIGTPPGTGPWTLNLQGYVLNINTGTITASSSLAGTSTINLSTSPLVFTLPNPTNATLTTVPGPFGTGSATMTAPVNLTTPIAPIIVTGVPLYGTLTITGTAVITGSLRMTTSYVPEPGTAMLLLSGIVVLARIRRARA